MNKNKVIFIIQLSPLFFSFVIALIIFTILKFLPQKLPLFYSLPWGEGQLATHQQFFIIPASMSVITLINLIISWQLHVSQAFFKNTLLITSILTSLILIIALVKIILLFI